MIVVTRLDGSRCALNDELVERVDEGATTIIHMQNGNVLPIMETIDEVLDAIVEFRGRALAHVVAEGRAPALPMERPRLKLATDDDSSPVQIGSKK